MRHTTIVMVLVLSLSAGCGYLQDRLKDGSEILEAGLGLSTGFEVNLRATKVFQVGLGSYSGHWAGLREGRFTTWWEERVEMGITPFYFHELYRVSDPLIGIQHPLPGGAGYEEYLNDFFLLTDRGFFEIGVTTNLFLFGVDLALEGAELADFLTGWFGWDLLADDCYARPLEDLVCQAQSRDPDQRAAAIRALRLKTGENQGYVISSSKEIHPRAQLDAWEDWCTYRDGDGQTD